MSVKREPRGGGADDLSSMAEWLLSGLVHLHRDTAEHSRRLSRYAGRVAVDLGMSAAERRILRYGAKLHDIGKVGVGEAILGKAAKLDAEEFAAVRRHPELGARLLEAQESWGRVRQIVRHHHERWDGQGYPDGLSGTRIPLGARIVAVVDAFDVMVEGRPYQAARSVEAALQELRACAGSQFDGDVVEAFSTALVGHRVEHRHQPAGMDID